ncbi:MAG: carbamoyltransferase, partial [Actinomycetes bacterium]
MESDQSALDDLPFDADAEISAVPHQVVLGVSCDGHDAAAALVVDGKVVAAAEEAKFTRVPLDGSLPVNAVAACLRVAGLNADVVGAVAFYEKPLNVVDRVMSTHRRRGPRGLWQWSGEVTDLLGDRLQVGRRIRRMMRSLGASSDVPVRYLDHHRSHAAAAYFPSPFDHAAVLTFDGVGEWATASIGRGAGHTLDLLEELRFPDSVGLVYSFVTEYLGLRGGVDDDIVMGLAPYGQTTYLGQLRELSTICTDGSVHVDAARFGWFTSTGLRRRELHGLLGGPPRSPGGVLTQRDVDLAASVQHLLEESVVSSARHAHELTGLRDVCMSGGVARNVVANGRIVWTTPFDRLWVQPAPGNAGSAVGAALELWFSVERNHRVVSVPDGMSGALLGPRTMPAEVDSWIEATGLVSTRFDNAGELHAAVAHRLADGAVVGWCGGRLEFGANGLGSRSIFADPRSSA